MPEPLKPGDYVIVLDETLKYCVHLGDVIDLQSGDAAKVSVHRHHINSWGRSVSDPPVEKTFGIGRLRLWRDYVNGKF